MKVSIRPLLIILMAAALLTSCSMFNAKNQTAHKPAPETGTQIDADSQPQTSQANPIKPSKYANIWDRVRDGYGLPAVSDSRVNTYLRNYNQRYLTTFSTLAEPYIYYVVSEMEANGIPLELALIPVIESSYNPHVVSPSNTAGIWQFIPETGRNFGLKQTSGYSGRKDVVASTAAVIRYLKKLHSDFDQDWLLVLAAYNSGEGTVANAIEKNKRAGKATDFWSLPLPAHTQTYVPRLIALAKVVANPQRFNLSLNPIPDTPYFVKVNVDRQINLAQAAKQANIDANALKKLNSGMSGWVTPAGGYQVLVPVADAANFAVQLNNLPPLAASSIPETTDTPAAKSGKQDKTRARTAKTTKESAAKQSSAKEGYTVKSGENLWSIAKAQNTSVNALAKLNNLSSKSVLKPGQKILVLSQANPEADSRKN